MSRPSWTKNDESKLPKWAQQELAQLRGELERYARDLEQARTELRRVKEEEGQ